MLVATQLAVTYLGKNGSEYSGRSLGVSDVDPFIMGMTQAAPLSLLSNRRRRHRHRRRQQQCRQRDLRLQPGRPQDGVQSLAMLLALAAMGLIPLFWLG